MTALKAEIFDLIEEVPEENFPKLLTLLKNFLKSEESISDLAQRIDDAKNGRNMVEHKLIEVD